MCVLCAQSLSCLTLWDSIDCSPPRPLCPWDFSARVLEWVTVSSSRESSRPTDWTHASCISCIGRLILYHWATWEAHLVHRIFSINFRYFLSPFNSSAVWLCRLHGVKVLVLGTYGAWDLCQLTFFILPSFSQCRAYHPKDGRQTLPTWAVQSLQCSLSLPWPHVGALCERCGYQASSNPRKKPGHSGGWLIGIKTFQLKSFGP